MTQRRMQVGMAVVIASMLAVSRVHAQEQTNTLPTLLVKGEVVSLDASDPSVTLMRIKDRYGFETPLLLSSATVVTRGEVASTLADVTAGATVQVEYNFDINTAKRHVVAVKLEPLPPAAVAPPAAAESTVVQVTAPSVTPTDAPAIPPVAENVLSQEETVPASEPAL